MYFSLGHTLFHFAHLVYQQRYGLAKEVVVSGNRPLQQITVCHDQTEEKCPSLLIDS